MTVDIERSVRGKENSEVSQAFLIHIFALISMRGIVAPPMKPKIVSVPQFETINQPEVDYLY